MRLPTRSIPYGKQKIDILDANVIKKSVLQKFITTGNSVKKFEKNLRKFLSVNYAFTCTSGTAALHLSFLAINLKKNDLIIMPSVNFVAAFNLASSLGAKVILSDVNSLTGQMTPQTLKDCIKKNKIKKIKAFLTMHMGGHPEHILEFHLLKKKYNCFLIEDACHALGAQYKFKNKKIKIGSCLHSDICTFSLHPLKTITTGEGGVLTTSDKKIGNKIQLLRSHGLIKNKKFYWKYKLFEPGFNYRLSDLNCALGISQLKKINFFLNRRLKVANNYIDKLKSYEKYITIPKYNSNPISSWHLFLISLNFKNLKKDKDFFIKYLNKYKIFPQFHYVPIYRLKNFKIYKKANFPKSEIYFKKVISLPIYVDLSKKDQLFVINKISEYIRLYKKK